MNTTQDVHVKMSQEGNKTWNKPTVQNIAAMSPSDGQQTDS